MNTLVTSDLSEALISREASDTLETVARSAGYSLSTEYLSTETGHGYTVVTAPVQRDEAPSERELSEGATLLFSYLSIAGEERLTPGFYLIRVATAGYRFENGEATVSFVNLQGETVLSLKAQTAGLPDGELQEVPSFDDLTSPSRPVFGKICGKVKCFVWKRVGFLTWKFGCTNKESGNVVACVG